jgi:hypothetical protein
MSRHKGKGLAKMPDHTVGQCRRVQRPSTACPASVDAPEGPVQTAAFEIEGGLIRELYMVRNPAKLRYLAARCASLARQSAKGRGEPRRADASVAESLSSDPRSPRSPAFSIYPPDAGVRTSQALRRQLAALLCPRPPGNHHRASGGIGRGLTLHGKPCPMRRSAAGGRER